MNPCTVLQVMLAMFSTHVDTPANQDKIKEVLQYQQTVCAEHEKKAKKDK